MSSSDPSKALFMQHFLKDLTMFSGIAFHAADTHRATPEGAARKGHLKEMCGLEPRTNFFFD
jgi:DNA polymerase III epsilon subunit-like protein